MVVFTRDLRVHDNPALAAAVASGAAIVPLFILDDELLSSDLASPPTRLAFLAGSLRDLHESLRARGAGLLVRRGEWIDDVRQVSALVAATDVHVADDVTPYAQRRLDGLELAVGAAGVRVHRHVGLTVVPPGEVVPAGRDNYSVFTPYWRAWAAHPWRAAQAAPDRVAVPAEVRTHIVDGPANVLATLSTAGAVSTAPAGETAARRRLAAWCRAGLDEYDANHDDLASAATSGLSVYLHFGCLSPLEVATRVRGRPGGEPFARQLAWRDFFHQIVAVEPGVVWRDYRSAPDPRFAPEPGRTREFWAAWVAGRTGYPLVDAAMRQLAVEGFVHNRARMVAASFLTKDLGLPWRDGARHYLRNLVDGDLVVNNMNWQWVAGTGTDTNRHRVLNPHRQAERFDREAGYIKRHVPELAGLPGPQARNPDAVVRRSVGYPPEIVESASSRRR